MICFGVVNAICSIIFGTIMKYTGRIPIILLGMVVHGSIIIVLMFWRPSPEQPMVFFLISGLYGVGDAVWQTQINGEWTRTAAAAATQQINNINIPALIGIYGALFRRNKEAAFSNYRLWESAGFVIAYAYSTTLCALMKLYVLFSVLVLGILGWIIVEVRHRRKVRVVVLAQYLIKLIHRHFLLLQEARLRAIEQNRKSPTPDPRIATVPETDDEHDELEEDIVVTHL